jgi:hypothetical protein
MFNIANQSSGKGKSKPGNIFHLTSRNGCYQKDKRLTRHWWLIPVILATQEAEIRRISV